MAKKEPKKDPGSDVICTRNFRPTAEKGGGDHLYTVGQVISDAKHAFEALKGGFAAERPRQVKEPARPDAGGAPQTDAPTAAAPAERPSDNKASAK